jgi:hypothetical protein
MFLFNFGDGDPLITQPAGLPSTSTSYPSRPIPRLNSPFIQLDDPAQARFKRRYRRTDFVAVKRRAALEP